MFEPGERRRYTQATDDLVGECVTETGTNLRNLNNDKQNCPNKDIPESDNSVPEFDINDTKAGIHATDDAGSLPEVDLDGSKKDLCGPEKRKRVIPGRLIHKFCCRVLLSQK